MGPVCNKKCKHTGHAIHDPCHNKKKRSCRTKGHANKYRRRSGTLHPWKRFPRQDGFPGPTIASCKMLRKHRRPASRDKQGLRAAAAVGKSPSLQTLPVHLLPTQLDRAPAHLGFIDKTGFPNNGVGQNVAKAPATCITRQAGTEGSGCPLPWATE